MKVLKNNAIKFFSLILCIMLCCIINVYAEPFTYDLAETTEFATYVNSSGKYEVLVRAYAEEGLTEPIYVEFYNIKTGDFYSTALLERNGYQDFVSVSGPGIYELSASVQNDISGKYKPATLYFAYHGDAQAFVPFAIGNVDLQETPIPSQNSIVDVINSSIEEETTMLNEENGINGTAGITLNSNVSNNDISNSGDSDTILNEPISKVIIIFVVALLACIIGISAFIYIKKKSEE